MSNVDIDKKNCPSDVPTPRNLPPNLGTCQNLKSIFHHEAVILLQFLTSKMNSLTPKTRM